MPDIKSAVKIHSVFQPHFGSGCDPICITELIL
ncbi:hypothetical protein CF65_01543 [Aggregatibacter actinomycetemcomitans HK1651]|nr:hypothetical protein CF65_01543 [Aggregatibacter actinomycetemcomitans HK1651]